MNGVRSRGPEGTGKRSLQAVRLTEGLGVLGTDHPLLRSRGLRPVVAFDDDEIDG